MSDIRQQLTELKKTESQVNPSKNWKQNTRSFLLDRITSEKEVVETKKISRWQSFEQLSIFFVPKPVRNLARVAFTFVLVIGVTAGGWLTGVSASYNSLPGDVLYGVKLATEKTKVAMAKATGNQAAEIGLNLDHASRRVEDMKKVAENPEHVAQAANSFQKNVEEVNTGLKNVQQTDPNKAAELAKEVTEKIDSLSIELSAVTGEPTAQNSEVIKQVAESEKVIKDAELQAITIVAGASPEEGKALVEKEVAEILSDTAGAKLNLESVSDATTTGTISSTLQSTSTTPISNPSSLDSVENNVKKVVDNVAQVEAGVKEVSTLVQGNDIAGAVEKLKTLSDITTDTKQTLVEVNNQVKLNPLSIPSVSVPSTTIEISFFVPKSFASSLSASLPAFSTFVLPDAKSNRSSIDTYTCPFLR